MKLPTHYAVSGPINSYRDDLARAMSMQKERFMETAIRRVIGPQCPRDAVDMLTVLYARQIEPLIVCQQGKPERFVVRQGDAVLFDGEMPHLSFPR